MSDSELLNLERSIEKHPWYSIAHLELFKKMCLLGDDHKQAYLNKAAVFLYSREKLYNISIQKEAAKETEIEKLGIVSGQEVVSVVPPKELLEKEDEKEIEEIPLPKEPIILSEGKEEMDFVIEDEIKVEHKPKVVLVGGDYFTKQDFEALPLNTEIPIDKFIVEKHSFPKASLNSKEATANSEIEALDLFDDSGFYTETLAKIYTEQSFYKRAIDVYAKLILLYPEKSTYFATLVKELKTKNNQ